MKYVLLYESADDVATKAPQHFPAHLERIKEFQSRGEILMVGTFGDPQREGAMGVFPTRESVEAFVADDPFLVNGVIKSYEIREWSEILTADR
jgi:uncharacterized protein YciI